jgi:hypothetical protein
MKAKILVKGALAIAAAIASAHAAAQITLYEHEAYGGQPLTTRSEIDNLVNYGFNDRASSIIVTSGRWEVCEHANFGGQCVYLRPGQYPSLASMHLNDMPSSVRRVGRNMQVRDRDYVDPPYGGYDYGRRANERLFEAQVTTVRAVMAAPEQRCWVEREEVRYNAPGAVAGALIGGILGHQVGRGSGQDLATIGGAVAGGAIGANIGRSQDVQRCASVPSQAPSYYDVGYVFRGQEHFVQMTTPPGRTVTVNSRGEPRV